MTNTRSFTYKPCRVTEVIDGIEQVEVTTPELAEFWTIYESLPDGTEQALEDYSTLSNALIHVVDFL